MYYYCKQLWYIPSCKILIFLILDTLYGFPENVQLLISLRDKSIILLYSLGYAQKVIAGYSNEYTLRILVFVITLYWRYSETHSEMNHEHPHIETSIDTAHINLIVRDLLLTKLGIPWAELSLSIFLMFALMFVRYWWFICFMAN